MGLSVYVLSKVDLGEKDEEGNDILTESILYQSNITHNLAKMAQESDLYQFLWAPEEIDIDKAYQLIDPLEVGLTILKSDPDRFKKFNATNGWGVYENLVSFTEDYLEACKKYPKAFIETCR